MNETGPAQPPRRNFLVELLAVLVGALVALFPFAAGLFTFLDPMLRKPTTPRAFRDPEEGVPVGFIRVASVEAVSEQPRRFPVVADEHDAWSYSPDQPIGAVYLRKLPDESFSVLHTTCPHAGCSVSLSPGRDAYHCPCHHSSFDLDGGRVDRPGKANPSPRDMDTLEIHNEKLSEGEIWVKYENYYTGREEKKPKL